MAVCSFMPLLREATFCSVSSAFNKLGCAAAESFVGPCLTCGGEDYEIDVQNCIGPRRCLGEAIKSGVMFETH
jgi:hypothetical protein